MPIPCGSFPFLFRDFPFQEQPAFLRGDMTSVCEQREEGETPGNPQRSVWGRRSSHLSPAASHKNLSTFNFLSLFVRLTPCLGCACVTAQCRCLSSHHHLSARITRVAPHSAWVGWTWTEWLQSKCIILIKLHLGLFEYLNKTVLNLLQCSYRNEVCSLVVMEAINPHVPEQLFVVLEKHIGKSFRILSRGTNGVFAFHFGWAAKQLFECSVLFGILRTQNKQGQIQPKQMELRNTEGCVSHFQWRDLFSTNTYEQAIGNSWNSWMKHERDEDLLSLASLLVVPFDCLCQTLWA